MDPDEVTASWADREGEFSPRYYAYRGPDEASEAVREALLARLSTDAAVLEPGCSAGRHLAHLRAAGFADLHGIDVNGDAFAVMADAYPGLAADGTFRAAAIQDAVPAMPDDRFDAVFTVETLQHVPPAEEWVFGALARVAGELLVTVETEDGAERTVEVDSATGEVPLYVRDLGRTFADLGLEELESRPVGGDTMRVFRTGEG